MAFKTAFPLKLFLSPSLNSKASYYPVDAPLGTAAKNCLPLSKVNSTSTVGKPLESIIYIASIF